MIQNGIFDKIGKEFTVDDDSGEWWKLRSPYNDRYISKQDAVVVENDLELLPESQSDIIEFSSEQLKELSRLNNIKFPGELNSYERVDNNITKEQIDNVNKPSHYQSSAGFECIDVIREVTKDMKGMQAVCTANAIKYLYRWDKKNGIEDVKKSIVYLKWLVEELENNG